jgi:nucleotide-binding universal stress UspA family protein
MTIHIAGHDGTDRGSDAMALARRLALLHEAQLLAVHVLAVPSIRQHLTGRTVEDLEQDAGVALSRARAESSDVPGPPPRTVYAASPAAGLREACEDEAAALVTVGSSRHGLVGGVLAGSTAERLLTGSPCAVALAPVGYARVDAPFRRVVVGYDGGPESATAVDVAADIAARAGTGLKVVTVVEILGYDEAEDLAREGAQRVTADIDVEHATAVGDRATALIDASREAGDLLVIGSRGHGPARWVLAGTVGHGLARESVCPAIFVPRTVAPGATLADGTATEGARRA